MNTFELEIFDDEGSVCTFYTVKQEDSGLSETDKFIKKFRNNSELKGPLQDLLSFLIHVIGNGNGAISDYFRFENTAQALPPGGDYIINELAINFSGFPLRLYCLRISYNLVILFNGGEKTERTAQAGKTSMVFHEANQFAKKIIEALNDGTIYVANNGRELRNYKQGSELTL